MTGSEPTDPALDQDLPADLGFDATRAAQAAHWATTTPGQRLAWLTEAQHLAHQSGALPRPRPATDLEGWNDPAEVDKNGSHALEPDDVERPA